jgi:hypothetical protein
MTHTVIGMTQKYREKEIEQGKVPVCVYTRTAYVHYSNRAPLVPISLCSVLLAFELYEIEISVAASMPTYKYYTAHD